MRISHRLIASLGFSRATPQKPRCFTETTSLSPDEPIPGKKKTLARSNAATISMSALENINSIPFRYPREKKLLPLDDTRHKPSSRIELKYLSLQPAFNATTTTLLLVTPSHKPVTAGYRSFAQAPSIFRAIVTHSLVGYRLPWPPSCCLYQPTPFMGSHERKVRHLNPRQFCLPKMAHLEHTFMSTFENRLRSFRPQRPLIIRFTGYNHAPLLQLSWGKLRREPATRRLSPLYPSLSIDLHVRTDTDFHQSFLWLRPFTIFRVANYTLYRSDKTGPWCAAPKSGSHVNRLTGFSPPLDSRINYTPRSVFQDGSERWELALR
uniref:Uncharacterized protein n=1 Tax=Heterorhabditis bacteriophora TaxID=37862 RepID=A0A1I7WD61_HETBA